MSIHETPYLILGAANKVLKQNLMDLIHSVPDTIHDEHNRSIMVTGKYTANSLQPFTDS